MRVGTGFDVHPLVEGRPLILGGVNIQWHFGLDGHSDADVLIHAICDALLGAAGLGDIGKHFPPEDDTYKNIDSRILLRKVRETITENEWRIGNIDATIIAQRPKLAPYLSRMEQNIASDLGIAGAQINIKATTTEHLGFAGREEGIATQAIALIECST